jgi:hypothetical protein
VLRQWFEVESVASRRAGFGVGMDEDDVDASRGSARDGRGGAARRDGARPRTTRGRGEDGESGASGALRLERRVSGEGTVM